MTLNKEEIKKVTDISERMGLYIDEIREKQNDKKYVIDLLAGLIEFTATYFSTIKNEDRNTLKLISYVIINDLYKYASRVSTMDRWSDSFLEGILKRMFNELEQRNIYAFFVLDNSMEEDRRGAFLRIYSNAGFDVLNEPKKEEDIVLYIKNKIKSNRNTLLMFDNYELNKPSLDKLFNFLHSYSDDNHVVGYKSSSYLDTKSFAWGIVQSKSSED